MDAPVKWIEDNKQVGDCQILFTDGEVCAWPKKRDFPMIFVIASEGGHKAKPPDWGHVINIEI